MISTTDPTPIAKDFQSASSSSTAPTSSTRFYRLTHEEWLKAVTELKPAERDVLYYIRTLDPFGNTPLTLGVRDIATILSRDPGTISRALRTLDQKGYIELDLINVRVRIKNASDPLSPHNPVVSTQPMLSPHNTRCLHTTTSLSPPPLRSPEPPSSLPVENPGCTNNRKDFKKEQQDIDPPTHPVENGQREFGTPIDSDVLKALLDAIEDIGIRANQTIRHEVTRILTDLGASKAIQYVRNAISAVTEQMQLNKVRNPGGFLMKALRLGFTSNEEKRKARQSSPPPQGAPAPSAPHSSNPPPANPSASAPCSNGKAERPPTDQDLVHISMAVDAAMRQGDRTFALAKIHQLWTQWPETAIELCQIRRDWPMKVGPDGPYWQETQHPAPLAPCPPTSPPPPRAEQSQLPNNLPLVPAPRAEQSQLPDNLPLVPAPKG